MGFAKDAVMSAVLQAEEVETQDFNLNPKP